MLERASFENLNPLSFLERSVFVYPNKTAVIYKDTTYTYSQLYERVNRLAGALKQSGIGRGDRVAFLAPNVPAMLEGYFGPLMLGAIVVPLNTRLSSRELAYILNHSGAKALVFDSELAPTVRGFVDEVPSVGTFVQVVDVAPKADDIPGPEYEAFLESAPEGDHKTALDSELDTISINYTSGTTGTPKGVEYNARGAYLNALGEVLEAGVNWRSKYLWTVPMFHASGWCYPWGITAVGATHVCLRRVDPSEIYRLVREEGITHMCCAPTVLTMMYSSPETEGQDLTGLNIMTGGAPPAPQVIRTMENMGAYIHHIYGLTETYGPHTICAPQEDWDSLSPDELGKVKSLQGVPYMIAGTGLRVVDAQMNDVPKDGVTMGEVIMRGNNVMSGYFAEPDAVQASDTESFGWAQTILYRSRK